MQAPVSARWPARAYCRSSVLYGNQVCTSDLTVVVGIAKEQTIDGHVGINIAEVLLRSNQVRSGDLVVVVCIA